MQQLFLNGTTKEQEAITFLQEQEPPEGYFLAFSGGKDSCVIKALADMAGVKYQAYYSATGIDPPEITKFIKRHHSDVVFLKPKIDFYSLLIKKGYPTKICRWCCDELKKIPTKDIKLGHKITGVRAEESSRRANKERVDYQKSAKQWLYKPIFSWLEWEIWEFIERHNIPYCSLYDEGFDRIGCVVCPFICHPNNKKITHNKSRWPGVYAAFERAMKTLWDEKQRERAISKGYPDDFNLFLQAWYDGM